jgi:hypothetical protein
MIIVTLATIAAMAVALFAAELSLLGVPGIWFPYGVGVSRTQYALAVAIPLLAALLHMRAAAPPPRANTRSATTA